MSTKGMFQEHSTLNRVRQFFAHNPDEGLTASDVATKFDCTPATAARVMWQLVREGLNESCYVRVRARRGSRALPFPANLSPGERKSVEAYAEHGTFKAAGRALGMSEFTIADHLKCARTKAQVHESVVLVAKYLRATLAQAEEVAA